MNPQNTQVFMRDFIILGVPGLPGFIIGKRKYEKSLSRLKK
jgi:hypothetical protein